MTEGLCLHGNPRHSDEREAAAAMSAIIRPNGQQVTKTWPLGAILGSTIPASICDPNQPWLSEVDNKLSNTVDNIWREDIEMLA